MNAPSSKCHRDTKRKTNRYNLELQVDRSQRIEHLLQHNRTIYSISSLPYTIMSANSSVGTSGVYEAGDQRNYKDSELNQKEPYNEGKENAHSNLDSSKSLTEDRAPCHFRLRDDAEDERSIANRLAAEEVTCIFSPRCLVTKLTTRRSTRTTTMKISVRRQSLPRRTLLFR